MSDRFTHFDADGQAHMVDVSDKPLSARRATAEATVRMDQETLSLVIDGQGSKGDVLSVAELAGIMAAKRTSDLIPLCHPLPIDDISVSLELLEELLIDRETEGLALGDHRSGTGFVAQRRQFPEDVPGVVHRHQGVAILDHSDFAGEQDFGPSTATFVTRQAKVGDQATINWAVASVGSRLHRSRIENLLEGRGANVSQVEIGFGDQKQLFDLTSYTRHIGQDGTSDLLSKGVYTDKSRGYIKGLIDIPYSGRGTDSFLGEFSMLLERTARSVTIPSLEIDQPDCRRAMHSSDAWPRWWSRPPARPGRSCSRGRGSSCVSTTVRAA